jgi:hypothetical protein
MLTKSAQAQYRSKSLIHHLLDQILFDGTKNTINLMHHSILNTPKEPERLHLNPDLQN